MNPMAPSSFRPKVRRTARYSTLVGKHAAGNPVEAASRRFPKYAAGRRVYTRAV